MKEPSEELSFREFPKNLWGVKKQQAKKWLRFGGLGSFIFVERPLQVKTGSVNF